ncbi:MAG: hypothetical protein HY908_18715 [Myxococcales bacterium]|nr:hypothetical protein [Myxococcales bacterium]
MRSRAALPFALALALATICLGPRARADAPPPGGQKYVGFAFRVDGLAAFADLQMLAYPTSQSNGAPTHELTLVEDGRPVPLGRRSPAPKLYLVKKAAWEAFRAGYQPATDRRPDPTLEAFLASDAVATCDPAPTLVRVLSTSDPRDAVTQTFRLAKADGKSCALEVTSPPEPPPGRGCAACAVGARGRSGDALGAAVGALLAALVLRRARR